MVGRARIEIDALGKFVNLVADLIVTVPLRDYRLWSDLRPLPPALEGHLVINIATNCGGIGISLNGTDRCGHQEDKKGTNQANHLSIIEGSSEPITGSKMNSSEDVANVRICAGFSDARHDAGGWARGCRRPRSAKARNRGGLSGSMGI